MGANKKWNDIGDILLRVMCTDDDAFKTAVYRHNAGVSAEATKLHEASVVIDINISGLENDNWMTAGSGLTAMGVVVPDEYNADAGAVMKNLSNIYWATHRSPKRLMMADRVDDILEAKRSGKIAVIVSASNIDFMRHRDLLGAAEVYSMAGFRVVQIASGARNFVADTVLSGTNAGITEQGKTFLKALKANGITIDLGGTSDQSFNEALHILDGPVLCSGSVSALYPHPWNLSDKKIKALADAGGVICLSADPELNWNGRDLPTVDRFVDAVAHVTDVAGVDSVGLGTGLCGQPGGQDRRGVLSKIDKLLAEDDWTSRKYPYPEMLDAGWGIESASTMGLDSIANLPCLTECLLRRGFSKEEIKKILGENMLRVFRETWLQ